MKFEFIEILFLIWILPGIFFLYLWAYKQRKKIVSSYSSIKGIQSISPNSLKTKRCMKATFLMISILFIIFALAGPQYDYKWQEIKRKGIDIIIALDCSKSMIVNDIKPSRIGRAKREIIDLLNMLKGDRVGLVAFSGTAFLQCPLTLDYSGFKFFLNSLTPDFIPVGGTDISKAIETSISAFSSDKKSDKAIILITDGESTVGDPVESSKIALDKQIKIFCVGIGKTTGVPIQLKNGGFKKDQTGNIVLTRLDENTLKKISIITRGTFVRSVAGDMDLDIIYNKEIRRHMEVSTLSSNRKKIWENRYQWFLGFAILFMLIEIFMPSIKKSIPVVLLFILLPSNVVYSESVYSIVNNGIKEYQKEKYKKSLDHFLNAQIKEPESKELFYNVGNAYYKNKDYEEALKNYEKVLNSEAPELDQKTHFNMGNTLYKMGKLDHAIKQYEEAVKLNPDDKRALENIEFVKKIKKQMKNKNPTSDSKKSDNNSKEEGKEHNKNKKNNNSTQKKEKKNPQKENNNEKIPSQKKNDLNKKQTSPDKISVSEKEKKQIEKLLNRLEDKPGKAMIPFNKNGKPQKDW